MVTDKQVRLLMKGIQREKSLAVAAAKAGMSEKTARRRSEAPPPPSTWLLITARCARTRTTRRKRLRRVSRTVATI